MGLLGKFAVSATCLLAGATLLGCGTSAAADRRPATLHGVLPGQHSPEPDIVLHDTSGRPFALPTAAAGKVTLLYFGYTHCPDTCPTMLADAAVATRELPPSLRGRVVVVFVTTDPLRDTATVLRRWLDRFDPAFVGLVGTVPQIQRAERTTGIPLATTTRTGAGGRVGSYAVDHFAAIFTFDRTGRLAVMYPEGVPPQDIAVDLTALAEGRPVD